MPSVGVARSSSRRASTSGSISVASAGRATTTRCRSRSRRTCAGWPASPTKRSSVSRRPSGLRSTDLVSEPLEGTFSAEHSARLLRNYRYVVERTMRALGGWIALTPELSAKLLMGRHVWDLAQQCDAFGQRLPELRSRAHVSEAANPAVATFMDSLEDAEGPDQTVERLVGVYGVVKPHLLATYRDHLARANPVYEPPTRRILARCIDDEERHIAAGETILKYLAASPPVSERT